MVRGVQVIDLPDIWPRVAPLVARALEHADGDQTALSVKESLEAGNRQLFVTWPEVDAMVVTAIESRPGQKVLHIFACAGRLPVDWRAILGEIERWAAAQGCRRVELQGRKGWVRMLPDYRPTILLRKELAA
jgi:hypothetical protein